ncbi:multiple sugar transport system permease protein [Thermosporothrix hazakensis]|uniref:Multiple sugar transport system permease protein n=3 Tax=Thermosporothrix TaxID=768650 RepID=A0A326U2X2_THEHA|nr:sugar ABC transporter permease [Thermosporothrix hazakensis]PZW26122.1 multiple sugar transport system permease protein [Thermosporothrix hazakensis]BBH87151.1 sugar ABC transporter permease [Thermosporothrix sp. COM3]GCE51380.1 sugar ABC transporter permease [Thermosporothrix hazakensis]
MRLQLDVSAMKASVHRNRWRRTLSEAFWGGFFLLPQLIGLVTFSLIPLVIVLWLSLVHWDGLGEVQFVGLQNFIDQLSDPNLRIAFVNTTIYTLITVPGGILLALLVALGLNKVRGKTIYRIIYFMPVVTSSVATGVIWLWLLNSDAGFINVLLRSWFNIEGPAWLIDAHWVIPSISIVSIWSSLGSNMVIFLAGLQNIPSTYIEAARIDGANRFQLFWKVTLPLLSPTLFFITVLSIISSFQVFDQTFVMTQGGPDKASYTIVYHIYNLSFRQFTFGPASASAMILFAVLLVLTLIQFAFQKRWVNYDL